MGCDEAPHPPQCPASASSAGSAVALGELVRLLQTALRERRGAANTGATPGKERVLAVTALRTDEKIKRAMQQNPRLPPENALEQLSHAE